MASDGSSDDNATALMNAALHGAWLTVEQHRAEASVCERLLGRPAPPVRIGRYEIHDSVGNGASGSVYRARDPRLDRAVAIKVLFRDLGRDGTDEARLAREARAIAAVSDPNVITVYDVGFYASESSARRMFIAMELVEGTNLATWIDHPRTWQEIVAIYRQAARGLAAAHARGIVHRDFKPANVLVGHDGTVKVADFGLARVADAPESTDRTPPFEVVTASSTASDRLTRSGTVMGTPRYMAPEQHDGHAATPAADQFAFATALFEALYGAPPFQGRTFRELSANKRRGTIARVTAPRAIPDWLDRAVRRGLATRPEDRWPSMIAFAEALAGPTDRRFIAAVAVGIVATLSWIGWSSVTTLPAACERDPLTSVWSSARSDAVTHALASVGTPAARHAAQAVPPRIDAWVSTARQVHEEACDALRRDPDDLAASRRRECIEEHGHDLTTLLQRIEEVDAARAERVVAMVVQLPRPDECRRAREADPPPREEVVVLRRRLADARLALAAGEQANAREQAAAIVHDAREIGDAVTLGRALSLLGGAQYAGAAFDDAVASYQEAFTVAAAAGDDEIAASAAGRVTTAYASDLGRLDDAAAWMRHTETAFARLEDPSSAQRVMLHIARAAVANETDRIDDAVHELEAALEFARADGDELRVIAVLTRLAIVQGDAKRYDEVIALHEEALSMNERVVGPDHPELTAQLNGLASAHGKLGDTDGALRMFERIQDILERTSRADDPRLFYTRINIGLTLQDAGRSREAIDALEPVLGPASAAIGDAHPAISVAWHALGRARVASGATEAGLRDLEQAQRHLELVDPEWHPKLMFVVDSQARTLMQLGRHADAIDRIADARARTIARMGPVHEDVANADLLLGEILLDAAEHDQRR